MNNCKKKREENEKESKEKEYNELENETKERITWDAFDGISTNLMRGIYAIGFETPSPIQSKGILPILQKHHVMAQAQSGTGKTGTFVIGTLATIDTTKHCTQALVLAPTKELAEQSKSVFEKVGSFLPDFNVQVCYGGSPSLSTVRPPHVICGCPGRIYDMLCRRIIRPAHIQLFVLDEADKMLTDTFESQIADILHFLNKDIQLCFFSATFQPNIEDTIQYFAKNADFKPLTKIKIDSTMLTLEGIQQYFVAVYDDMQKYLTIANLLSSLTISQCFVYCNSVQRVIDLYESLRNDDCPVCCLHSKMSPEMREQTYQEFKQGKHRLLISTDLTARGLDIQQVNYVINFDLPNDVHTYLHRIGRSGRWGRKGVAINLVTQRNISQLKEIERYYNTQINELPQLDLL